MIFRKEDVEEDRLEWPLIDYILAFCTLILGIILLFD